MLDMIDQQVKRSGTAISIHKFKLLKNNNSYAFLFVEGDDDVYFYPLNATTMVRDKQILPLNCSGKEGVVEANEILSSEISKDVIVGFFVDKDFDDDKNEFLSESIYITPAYSVENLVYNRETFINFLIRRFGLTPLDDSYRKCLDLYEKLSKEFYDSINLYNSWIYAQRNYITTDNKLNLPKCLPEEFVCMKTSKITREYDLMDIEKKHPKAPKVPNEIMALASKTLMKDDPELRFRGKFNWKFFAHIISMLIEDANNDTKRRFLPNSVKFNVNKKDSRKFFEEVAPFAKTPACLLEYLVRITT